MTSGPSPKLCFPTCKFIFLSSRIDASLVAISHFFQIKLTYPLSFLTFIIKYARIRNNIWCWLLLHFVSGWSYILGGAGSPFSDTLILYVVNVYSNCCDMGYVWVKQMVVNQVLWCHLVCCLGPSTFVVKCLELSPNLVYYQ